MPPRPESGRPRMFRRRYLIDKSTQLRVLWILISGVAATAVAFVGALYIYFVPDANVALSGIEVRNLLLQVNWLYFALASMLLAQLVVLITHRFVGPAYVFRQALEGMLAGDYGRRLSLRKSDFLRDLGARLSEMRDRWVGREKALAEGLDRLEQCLANGDTREAERTIAALREGVLVRSVQPEPEPDVPAPGAEVPSRERATSAL